MWFWRVISSISLVIICILSGLQAAELPQSEELVRLPIESGHDYHSRGSQKGRFAGLQYVPGEIIVKYRKEVAVRLVTARQKGLSGEQFALTDSLEALGRRYRIRKVEPVFRYFKDHRRRIEALADEDQKHLNLRERRLIRRQRRAPIQVKIPALDRIYKLDLELQGHQRLEEAVASYRNDPAVEYAELNYIISANLEPNDPLYALQWPLNNTGQMYPESGGYNTPPGTPDCDIDAPEAWDFYTGGPDVIVAVVDTGVDYRHRDINDNMWVNSVEIASNGIDDDDNGYVDDIYGYDFINNDSDPCDDHGHGTHCAGIIAAEGNTDPNYDIAGVCWIARIMALKFLGSDGYGSTSDAVSAFYYVVANGADVISNSWGGGSYSYTMKDAIDYAHSQGVILVAAAGNDYSNEPEYPGAYEHMISVAATNSNDKKAPFSNYGDWVDIAAPGVDILSLRAEGTSLGTVYDDYTTVASGTSMACPHVAGACALLLSVNPLLIRDELYDSLIETVDPISPGICIADGRLNLHNAIAAVVPSQGYISFDGGYYSCSGIVSVFLIDYDLRGQDTQAVNITTSGGDSETLLLTKDVRRPGIFTGTISIFAKHVKTEDGKLQVQHDQFITAIYEDANDGTGEPAVVTDTALVDCIGPVISEVQTGFPGREPRILFDTDEPATARVRCGLACGGPYTIEATSMHLTTSHSVKLVGMSQETEYFYIVEATDEAGNLTVEDNGRACYPFTTTGVTDINVPLHCLTIQEAIDNSWDGGTVLVADDTYTGPGNRDIDFLGKAITVRSENSPENCVIDCNGTQTEPHRGFYFHSGEDSNSIVEGFTIINGYAPDGQGGAIKCIGSSPLIDNCIIRGNWAEFGGGVDSSYESSPTLTDCIFQDNTAEQWGGGMENWVDCNATLINCSFLGNAAEDGGAMSNDQGSDVTLVDCTFNNNSTIGIGGGGVGNYYCDPKYTNCTFNYNIEEGMYNYRSSPAIVLCQFNDNSTYGMRNSDTSIPRAINCTFNSNSKSGMYNGYDCSPKVFNCTFSGNGGFGMENLAYNFGPITNCTFTGNKGGIYNRFSTPVVTNCIIWGNGGTREIEQICNIKDENGSVIINYSCVQGWTGNLGGIGNIGDDPLFVEADGADNEVGTEDDNLRLLGRSPCIDAGDNDAVPPDTTDIDGDGDVNEPIPFDLDGNPRLVDDPYTPDSGNGTPPVIDMGAYEGPKQGFLLNTNLVTVVEGQTATFTVALAMDPLGTVEVTVAVESGDSDITVDSGALLIFDSFNYCNPQTVTLAAAEDVDYLHGEALIWVSAAEFVTAGLDASELDNDTPPILYVAPNAPGANDGTSWADAFTDLQNALDTAVVVPQAEEIHVAQGIYRPTGPDGDREATFQLISGIAIKGGYAGFDVNSTNGEIIDPNTRDIEQYETILSGDLNGDDIEVAEPGDLKDEPTRAENSYNVVTGSGTDETAVLDGFTVTGGNANGFDTNNIGGGMYNVSGNPTVLNCIFIGNSAGEGGGMYNSYSSPTLTNCTFTGNSGLINGGYGGGGGISNTGCSNPVLTNCTISGNIGGSGGGMFNCFSSSPIVNNCTISGNSAQNGGGMYNYFFSSPIVTNCTFSGNTANTHGGGIYCKKGSSPTISNCTFIGNTASSEHYSGYGGGGICFFESSATVSNCKIINNVAIWSGGGIYGAGSNLTITNCIFSGNKAKKGSGTPISAGGGICNCVGPIRNCTFEGNSATDEGGAMYGCVGPITNCIIWWNTASIGNQLFDSSLPTYSCIQDWTEGGEGNINGDPCFVDATAGDYHLKSQAGRWDANSESWSFDGVTSPCIDAGDPNSDWTAELWPHGERINMGAYGGTPQASMSLLGAGNIADLNNDGFVDFTDLLLDKWLYEEVLLPEDLNRDGIFNFEDFAIFASNWKPQTPAPPPQP